MKKDYQHYLDQLNNLKVKEMAQKSFVSEQLIRLYKNGKNIPRLETAVLLEKEFNIPCEFWVQNKEKANS